MRRNLILTIILAVALTFTFTAQKVSADQLMFPWIVKSSTVSTVISVVNTKDLANGNNTLHYEYWFKNAGNPLGSCEHVSKDLPTTRNDVVTFDAAGNINGGMALFTDTNAGKETYHLNVSGDRRAYLLVHNGIAPTDADGTMYGEAMVFEIQNGAAWGYVAANGVDLNVTVNNTERRGNFGNGRERYGEVVKAWDLSTYDTSVAMQTYIDANAAKTVILPFSLFETRYYMTPTRQSDNATGGNEQRFGNLNANFQLCSAPDCPFQGAVYDNDERVFDGTTVESVTCTTSLRIQDILAEGIVNNLTAIDSQAWAFVVVGPGTGGGLQTDEMMIGKLEFTIADITLNSTTVAGPMNNFIWVRQDCDETPYSRTIGGVTYSCLRWAD